MITKIYLIRHAAAEGNLFREAHGQYNSNLTPMGYRQLWYLQKRFENVHLDAVCGSDLLRAHATASALYLPRGLGFQPVPALREVNLGGWEKRTWGELQRTDPEAYVCFNFKPDLWRVQGAETFQQVRDRMLDGILQIAGRYPGKTVAATSHGAAMRILLGTAEGLSLREIGRTGHADNTAVSLLEVEDGRIRLLFRDDASHIPPELSTFRRQSWYKSDKATEPGLWFRTLRDGESGAALAAMLDDEKAGRIEFALEPGRLRITAYELEPKFRGQHYGVQLLGQAVRYARENGRGDIVLTCPDSTAGFFAKFGFVPVSSQPGSTDMSMDIRLTIRDIIPPARP